MEKNSVEATIQDNKVIYKRYFDVPVELAFEAWSSHEHVSQWWGPDGFTITTKSMNFSSGGIWDFTMHGPDGQDYKCKIKFTEITKPHRICYRHLGEGEDIQNDHYQAIITFEESGKGTNLTFQQIFSSKKELEEANKHSGAIEGGKQHLGNLGKYLETL